MRLPSLILFAFLVKLPLAGSVLTVNSLGDTGSGIGNSGDLRYVIGQANSGDSIVFSVSGTISLNSQLNIGASVTITGLSITIDGSTSGTIFNVTGSASPTFSNLTLMDASTAAITGSGSANVSVANSTIFGNNDGILNVNATVINSSLAGNSGAAISGGTLVLSNSTIANGNVGLLNANATVTNSTFGGNAIGISGGTVTLYDSTISGGTTGTQNTNLTSGNSIIAGDTTDLGSGTVGTSLGHNLIGSIGSGSGFTNGVDGDQVGANANPINPFLGPLANNGGPTLTYAILAGSPAIEAGDISIIPSGVTTDQRGAGFPRTFNGTVDIGSYELITPEPTTYVACLLGLAIGALRLRKR